MRIYDRNTTKINNYTYNHVNATKPNNRKIIVWHNNSVTFYWHKLAEFIFGLPLCFHRQIEEWFNELLIFRMEYFHKDKLGLLQKMSTSFLYSKFMSAYHISNHLLLKNPEEVAPMVDHNLFTKTDLALDFFPIYYERFGLGATAIVNDFCINVMDDNITLWSQWISVSVANRKSNDTSIRPDTCPPKHYAGYLKFSTEQTI